MTKKIYETTGMFIDWTQLNNLPIIDTLIDIGVGSEGTPDLYEKFESQKLVLVDPLDEAEEFAKKHLKHRDVVFFKLAVGNEDDGKGVISVQDELGNSSLLESSEINYHDKSVDKRPIKIMKLDTILKDMNNLGRIGIKVDVEGFELAVIKGAGNTLKNTKFVLAEVRHNYESFKGVYKLHEFIKEMQKNNFILTMIITAKPFIADLCFQPIEDLNEIN
jgi:FkbM family methyltransferase